MDEGSSQAMLIAATTGLSAGIEAGYGIALHVDDLGSPVDPETTVRLVPDGIERRRVEWRFFDLVHGRIRPPRELRIATLVHVRVPLRHRFHQVSERNSLELMTAVDLLGQLLDRIGAEEEPVSRRRERRGGGSIVTLHRRTVGDRPNLAREEDLGVRIPGLCLPGKHIRIGITRGQVSRDMERAGVRDVLLHPCEVRSDPHGGDDAAGVLPPRSQQGPAAGHESRLSECRVEHAAELRIGAMTSGADDDRLASPDVYRLGTIVDVAVLPEALQTSSGLRSEPRRIAGPDTHNAARELLLANNLVHVAVEYEPHTFFTSGKIQAPGKCPAAFARALACDQRSLLPHTWREGTPAYL